MDEQGPREPHNRQAWERYMEAERQELQMRREGHLARLLGPALPDESPEEIGRIAEEDRLRAQEGLVELMDARGRITHKHIDELTPQDRTARVSAEGARIEWITERKARRPLLPHSPDPTDPADR
jgi:hypothetical protein